MADDFVHALNRGTDKRPIAMDDADRARLVIDLYEMNSTNPVENTGRTASRRGRFDLRGRTGDRLVTIHAWCLMRNHYHLLLSPVVESGISTFLMKFNVGYTKYFNMRHDRSGVLFQGKTKRVPIESDRQFLYIVPYIHLNPLDYMKGGQAWRTQCLKDTGSAYAWVLNYRWSSMRNYAGESEYSEILEGSELFADRRHQVREIRRYLRMAQDPDLAELRLE